MLHPSLFKTCAKDFAVITVCQSVGFYLGVIGFFTEDASVS
jgi:hypothetical protein